MIGDDQIAPDATSTIRPAFKSIDVVRAIAKFEGELENTLDFNQNDTIHVLSKGSNGWLDGIIEKTPGEYIRGWFPAGYVRSLINNNLPFSKFSKLSLSDSGSYPNSRRNSAVSVESSITESQKEINILTTEEVNSLCERVLAQTNEPPIWVPQLTQDGELIYYNESFNAYSRQLPFTSSPSVDSDSLLKFPLKTNLSKLDSISIPRDDESQERLNYKPESNSTDPYPKFTTQRPAAQIPPVHSHLSQPSPHTHQSSHTQASSDIVSLDFSKSATNVLYSDDSLFYTDPSDMKTWAQLYKTFVFLLDLSFDALTKGQTSVFSTHYNNVTKVCTLFQLSARLVQTELVAQNLDYSVQTKLKKMTNSVAQLGINGDLYLSLQPGLDSDENQSIYSDSASSINVDMYLEKVRNDIRLLKKKLESCYKIFCSIKYDDPQHDPSVLPQLYPRFLKDVFDGGNWINPLFAKRQNPFHFKGRNESISSSNKRMRPFQDRSNRAKILLDKDAISTLESKKAKLTNILADLLKALETTVPEGMDAAKFKEERNIRVLSATYNILQPASRIMDILEAFDFSVFDAAKKIPYYREGNKSISQETEDSASLDHNSIFFEKELVSYTYPLLIEFFEFKQELYDCFSQLIMDAQGLTLDDPEVFKGIREDDLIDYNKAASELLTEKLAAKLKALLIETDINNSNYTRLQFKKDDKLKDSIENLGKSLGMIIYSVQQLINERESILNYSSRNMNVEFDISIFMGERHSTMPDLIDDYRNEEVSHPRKLSRDVPWYLDIDEAEYTIIYDSKGNIKGGSLDGLIAYLTSNSEKDPNFTNAFLLTFRSFISPIDLIRKFKERYNISPPEGLSFEEYNMWIEKKLLVVRKNIANMVWLLLVRFWNHYYYDERLMSEISDLLERASNQIIPNKNEYYDKMKELGDLSKRLTSTSVGSKYKIETAPVTTVPPPPILRSSSLRRLKLRDIDSFEMARQLTIREFAFYSRITELEFLDKIWGEKYGKMGSSANIKYFISYANKLTNFVSFMIVKHKDLKKRADTIVYFLQVCEKCLQLKNYSSLTAVISALSSSPIARLKKTWAKVPANYLDIYNRLDKLMSIDRNYNEYRDLLKFVKDNEPCIPFLGIYLTDLTFVSQAISDYVNNNKEIIHFYKRFKIYYTITESLKYERVPYNFQIVHEIQSFLDNWFLVSPDVNDQHKISLALEPRVVPSVK